MPGRVGRMGRLTSRRMMKPGCRGGEDESILLALELWSWRSQRSWGETREGHDVGRRRCEDHRSDPFLTQRCSKCAFIGRQCWSQSNWCKNSDECFSYYEWAPTNSLKTSFFGALCTIDEKQGFLDQMSILITWDRFSWLKTESWAINHEKVMVTVSRRRLPNKVRDKLVPVLPSLIWPPLRPWPTHCLLCSQLPHTFSQPSLPPTHTFITGWKTMTFSYSAFPHPFCRKHLTLWFLLLKNSDIFLSDISSSPLPFFSCSDYRT